MKSAEILDLFGRFEAAVSEYEGVECWSARELQALLGYAKWENFSKVIDKAKEACRNAGTDVSDHFPDVRKMVLIGSGAEKEIDDILLTRYACYLIAQNGDSRKEQIAFAQNYFINNEILPSSSKRYKTLSVRDEVTDFLFYTTPDGKIKVEAIVNNETIWLTQEHIAQLFGVQKPAISKHFKNIFETGELDEDRCVSILETHLPDGRAFNMKYYNLDAIISVGYRVNSSRATQFRIWATNTLKDYIIKGFVMDDDRLKNGRYFGKDYFQELLERVRSIRASERVYTGKSPIYLPNVVLIMTLSPKNPQYSTQQFKTNSIMRLPEKRLRKFLQRSRCKKRFHGTENMEICSPRQNFKVRCYDC
jgi:hypothetical protein